MERTPIHAENTLPRTVWQMYPICTAKLLVQTLATHLAASRGMDLLAAHRGVDHMPRTRFIAQALKARQEALRFHNMPQEAIPNSEVMHTIVNSLRKQFEAEHIAQRPTESLRELHKRVRSAFNLYVFQAMTASRSYVDFDSQAFWESIRTNSFSEADHDDVKRYEDTQRAAQRHRNAVITAKIVKLGLCIARAWARNCASTRSLAEYMSRVGQPARSTRLVDARCDL
jgi:hypothetical protein